MRVEVLARRGRARAPRASPARLDDVARRVSRQAAATASNTSARSGRSGWPGGVMCSSKRGEEISSMLRGLRTGAHGDQREYQAFGYMQQLTRARCSRSRRASADFIASTRVSRRPYP